MNAKEIKYNSFKYFIYSILAWDHKDRKVEDDPRNDCYFFSPEYKKSFTKDLEIARKKNIIKIDYLGNDATSTNFNVYEKNDGEVIIAFRGSDSKIDWSADFAYFKQKFKEENNEKLFSMSAEDFNKCCMNEYKKSREDLFDKPIKFFREALKTNLSSFIDEIAGKKNFDFSDYGMFLKSVFEKYKSRIEFHGGFIKQYKSIYKELNMIIDKYIKDKRFKKIIFCGHSLGSALAMDTYILQSIRYPENNFECYAAGTPKIGNSVLAKFIKESKLGEKLFIMNIENDLVSNVPPDKLGFFKPANDVEITPLKAPFNTKMNHTLFYYLYCMKNFAPVKVNTK